MAMGFRERRLGCRLYVDRQTDAGVVKKLDRMLMDGSFPNQTELIKRGIELAYAEVYGEAEGVAKAEMSEHEISRLAEAVAGVLKPEIEKLVVDYGRKNSVTETLQTFTQAPNTSHGSEEIASDDEVALPSQTFSFLKGLNDD